MELLSIFPSKTYSTVCLANIPLKPFLKVVDGQSFPISFSWFLSWLIASKGCTIEDKPLRQVSIAIYLWFLSFILVKCDLKYLKVFFSIYSLEVVEIYLELMYHILTILFQFFLQLFSFVFYILMKYYFEILWWFILQVIFCV